MTFSPHAERWLTPGTEYAVTEKLPLPKEWYKNWDLDRTASQPSSAGNADSLDTEEGELLYALKISGTESHPV